MKINKRNKTEMNTRRENNAKRRENNFDFMFVMW